MAHSCTNYPTHLATNAPPIQLLTKWNINQYMWQSQVEIEHYSVAYFDRITVFEVLKCRTSVKGGAHICCVNVISIHEFTQDI